MDKLSELASASGDPVSSSAEEIHKPILGSARGTFVLPDGWDDPLTDAEMQDLFGL